MSSRVCAMASGRSATAAGGELAAVQAGLAGLVER